MKKLFLIILIIVLIALPLICCMKVVAPRESHIESGVQAISSALLREPMSYYEITTYLYLLNYTDKEIDDIMKNINVDYRAQCNREAIKIIDDIPSSRVALISTLEEIGYSAEDAIYAADNNNFNWNEQCYYEFQYLILKGLLKEEAAEQLLVKGYLPSEIDYAIEKITE